MDVRLTSHVVEGLIAQEMITGGRTAGLWTWDENEFNRNYSRKVALGNDELNNDLNEKFTWLTQEKPMCYLEVIENMVHACNMK